MAPIKKLRTYKNPNKQNIKPENGLNDLAATLSNLGLSLESSIDISKETTFDRLKKGEDYNNIVYINFPKVHFSNSGDSSYSILESNRNKSEDAVNSNSNIEQYVDSSYSILESQRNKSEDVVNSKSNIEQYVSSTSKPDRNIQTFKSLTDSFKTNFYRSPIATRSKLRLHSTSCNQGKSRISVEKNHSEFSESVSNMSFQSESDLEKTENSIVPSRNSTNISNQVSLTQSNLFVKDKLIAKRRYQNHHLHLNISGFEFKHLRSKCSTPVVIFPGKISKRKAQSKSNIYRSIENHVNSSMKHISNSNDLYPSGRDNTNNFTVNSHLETNSPTTSKSDSNISIYKVERENNTYSQHFTSEQDHVTVENNSFSITSSLLLTSTPLHKPKYSTNVIDISSDNTDDFSAQKSNLDISSKKLEPELSNELENCQIFKQIIFNKSDIVGNSMNCSNPLQDNSESDISNSSIISEQPFSKKYISLAAGKKFRRSMIMHKNSMCLWTEMGEHDTKRKYNFSRRSSVKVVPVMPKPAINVANSTILEESLVADAIYNSIEHPPFIQTSHIAATYNSSEQLPLIARDIVLQRCKQTEPLDFGECYSESALRHCQKIGEGVYGEVFKYHDVNGSVIVMKVIPIEGDQIINLEKQKTFEEIISEIVITAELSDLRKHSCNKTDAFTEVIKIRCVRGCYPNHLLELWDLYDENKHSENDSPEIFKSDQLYIVLELSNGGNDLEAFEFTNAQQSLSVFKQIACAIAVAEEGLHFEHRDLHWGNVLVKITDKEYSNFVLKGREVAIKNKQVKATIIDFTLSRIEYDGVVIFNDLSSDADLFSATGDYQFEIYRLMKKNNENEWQSFKPYSNILWLHYILDKAITGFRYKNTKSKLHKTSISTLKEYKAKILDYKSVGEFVMSNIFS